MMDHILKTDLHCHLDGSVRPSTLFELLKTEGYPMEAKTVGELLPLVQVPDTCPSLVDYLKRFSYPLQVMQSESALKRIAFEFMEDCQQDGLSYVEIRFAPILHTEKGLHYEAVLEAILQGLEEGQKATGIPFSLISCMMRHQSPEETLAQIKKTAPYIPHKAVAVDLAGDEVGFPPMLHQKTFELAKSLGFKITIHAGETGSWENIDTAIRHLYADRIGHGVAAEKNPALMALLKERQIPLEMCPTSNIQTKSVTPYEAHPILKYLREGLAVTLNTDNRTVSGVTSTSECLRLHTELGATEADFKKLAENSIRGAFAPDDVKSQLFSKL